MRERDIERKLVTAVKERGGWCLKFVSPGIAGVPDRIVLMPGGVMFFVEVKAPGQKPRKIQEVIHRKLRALGYKVYVIDDTKQIKEVFDDGIA